MRLVWWGLVGLAGYATGCQWLLTVGCVMTVLVAVDWEA